MHIPVLLQEIIDNTKLKENDVFLDCTLGSGGHTKAIAEKFGPSIHLIGIDRDADAIERATQICKTLKNKKSFVLSEFRNLDVVINELGIASVNTVLMDLGLSSPQIDDSGRGFSFRKDEPLLMTMEKDGAGSTVTAYDVVNYWSETSLADIIYGFGEERYSRRIAKAICEKREITPIKTTFELVHIIEQAVPSIYRRGRIHPATRTFQAIRIAVNNELGNIEEGVAKAFELLAPHGRLLVISFHSLEDRIIKNFFREKVAEGRGVSITKKPIVSTEEESHKNPRARSSKLRIIEKI
ncbi:MAG: 16S rRNA (cytosine(1402)-N(4))-methyltransferase RsmH [bacterium]